MHEMSKALVAGTLEHIRELERYQLEPTENWSGGGNRKERRAEAALERREAKRARKRALAR